MARPARICWIVFSCASFTSASGNDGCWAMSLISSKSRDENSESAEALIVVESASLPSPSVPPIERSSSLICLLERVSVPSFATDAAICAMPGCVSRSLAVVADRKVSIAETFGTFGSGARTTVNPLASFFSVILGRFNGLAAPGAGGVFCCAKLTVANRSSVSSIFMLVPFMVLTGPFLVALWLRERDRSRCDSWRPDISQRRL